MKHHKLRGEIASDSPFCHIVEVGDLVYLSGIIAADDLDAGPEAFASIGAETTTCLRLIEKMLSTVSLSLGDVTSVLVHMVDLDAFDAMNAAYGSFFEPGREPVRTCIAVAALLEGARIEITCQAYRTQ